MLQILAATTDPGPSTNINTFVRDLLAGEILYRRSSPTDDNRRKTRPDGTTMPTDRPLRPQPEAGTQEASSNEPGTHPIQSPTTPYTATEITSSPAASPGTTAIQQLAQGTSRAGDAYWDCIKQDPDLRRALGHALNQEPTPQAAKMAALVIIQILAQVKPKTYPNAAKIARIWDDALQKRRSKSYRPGMKLALDLLNILPMCKLNGDHSQPPELVQAAIREMCRTADLIKEELPGNDLAGPLLQKLPYERKELSNYHTRPWAATLMAHLAVPEHFEWSKPDRVKDFRIADYTCGSGILLMAAYRRIRDLHAANGGSPANIHEHMMEHSITGGDALPACASICSSNLAMTEPTRLVWKTKIVLFKKDRTGHQGNKRLGALDLLNPQLKDRQPLIALGTAGTAKNSRTTFRKEDQDLILMNPPFGATQAGSANSTTSDGSGMGCKFAHMAHHMVKRGGVIALTLPSTALIGMTNRPVDQPKGWQSFRHILTTQYTDVKVLSIAQYDDQHSSLSHDTNIAEIMIIARRLRVKENAPRTAHFINLTRQAKDDADATRMAQAIKATINETIRKPLTAEHWPPKPTSRIQMDGEDLGTTVLLPLTKQGAWPMAKNLNPEVLIAARALAENRRKSNPRANGLKIPITNLLAIAEPGPTNTNSSLEPLTPLEVPPEHGEMIPVLHGHRCDLQTSMTVEPTHWIADPDKRDAETLAAKRNKAGHLHLSNNTRYTSQGVAAAFTRNMTMGGLGWTTLTVQGEQAAKAFAAWLNSTLGMVICWPYLHHTQNGTGYTTARQLEELPVLDLTRVGRAQIQALARAFDSLANTQLLPACEAWKDPARKNLDQKVLTALGLNDTAAQELEWLRNNWCLEPTVQGKKGQVEHRIPEMRALAEMAGGVLPPKPRGGRKEEQTGLAANGKPAKANWAKRYNPLKEPARNSINPANNQTEPPPTIWRGPVYWIHLTERILPGNPLWTETVCGIAVQQGKSVTHAERRQPVLQRLHPDFWCDHCLAITAEKIPQPS